MKKLWIRDVKCLAKVTRLVSYGARTRTRVCPMPSILATQHLPLQVPGRDVTWSGSKGVALFLRFSWLQGTLTPKLAQNNHSPFLLKIAIKSQALFLLGIQHWSRQKSLPPGNSYPGAGKMGQWWRVLASFTEDEFGSQHPYLPITAAAPSISDASGTYVHIPTCVHTHTLKNNKNFF